MGLYRYRVHDPFVSVRLRKKWECAEGFVETDLLFHLSRQSTPRSVPSTAHPTDDRGDGGGGKTRVEGL